MTYRDEQEDDGDIEHDDPGDHAPDDAFLARVDPPCCGWCGECFE